MAQKRRSLRIEIILMLMIKLTILYFLWLFCFSHPVDKSLKPDNISAHLFGYSQGDTHES